MRGGCHTQTKKHTKESRQIHKVCLVVVEVVVVVVVIIIIIIVYVVVVILIVIIFCHDVGANASSLSDGTSDIMVPISALGSVSKIVPRQLRLPGKMQNLRHQHFCQRGC